MKHRPIREGDEIACSCGLRWGVDEDDPHKPGPRKLPGGVTRYEPSTDLHTALIALHTDLGEVAIGADLDYQVERLGRIIEEYGP